MPVLLLAVYCHDPHLRMLEKKKERSWASSCLLLAASDDEEVERLEDELAFW